MSMGLWNKHNKMEFRNGINGVLGHNNILL